MDLVKKFWKRNKRRRDIIGRKKKRKTEGNRGEVESRGRGV